MNQEELRNTLNNIYDWSQGLNYDIYCVGCGHLKRMTNKGLSFASSI
jgi:hypothetical protein